MDQKSLFSDNIFKIICKQENSCFSFIREVVFAFYEQKEPSHLTYSELINLI